jgi:hypothetical protein
VDAEFSPVKLLSPPQKAQNAGFFAAFSESGRAAAHNRIVPSGALQKHAKSRRELLCNR